MKASIASAVLAYLSVVASQGVTSKITAPGAAPSGCAASQNGVFGIQIVAAGSTPQKRAVSQIGDGQIQAATTTAAAKPVSQIGDGQVQAATSTAAAKPVTQISDGQIQAATKTAAAAVPVSQIGDGQIQAATSTAARMVTVTVTKNNCVASPITQISDGQIQAPMATPVTQINDGQIQAPTAKSGVAVSQITDGQIQAATKTAAAVSQITDGQIQAKSGTTLATSVKAAVPTTAATNAAGYAILPGAAQACASSSTLQLKLSQGVLTDAKNRTGYVAANYQFQFDGPPQTGAIYTAGFSLCSNGTLALGGEAFFYQCLSGTFYNLYYYPQGYKVPAQCQAIQIEAIQLNSC